MPKNTATPAATRGKPGPQQSQSARATASAQVATRRRGAEPQTAGVRVAPEQRQQLIAQAAYFIAERRGFVPGNELEDWLRAEAEIESWMNAALQ